jgi:hypothetical protein
MNNVKKVTIIVEAKQTPKQRKIKSNLFLNKTEDQFPYIEAAISILQENLKWWENNWFSVESLIENTYKEILSKTFELPSESRKIMSNFTIYNGMDRDQPDIRYSGPAIEYIFVGLKPEIVGDIQRKISLSPIIKGHKTFTGENGKIIIMF